MLVALQKLITHSQNEFLLFDEAQRDLFLKYSIPLLQSGYNVGVISTAIVKSLGLKVFATTISGVYTAPHKVQKPSVLCFSSGSKNTQKGIVRSFDSWQNSFTLIQDELTAFPNATAIVLGALPYSLSLFGAMESLQRGRKPIVFPTQELRHFAQLQFTTNYLLWATPLHCTFFVKAFVEKRLMPIKAIKYVFVGGAQFSNRQRAELQNVFPNAKIYSFYGTSETSFISLKHPTDTTESVGKICKGVAVSILDENHQKLSINNIGSIWINSKNNFDSYFQKALKINTLNKSISIDDRGFLNNQNQLFFTGRFGRQLSISGHIIDLDTLENWYKNALQIETLALVAQPNKLKENELVLMTSKNLSLTQWRSLKQSAQDALGVQSVPKKWLLCDEWPMLANGKTDLKTLEKWR